MLQGNSDWSSEPRPQNKTMPQGRAWPGHRSGRVGSQEPALTREGSLEGLAGPDGESQDAGKAWRRGTKSLSQETSEQRLGRRK